MSQIPWFQVDISQFTGVAVVFSESEVAEGDVNEVHTEHKHKLRRIKTYIKH